MEADKRKQKAQLMQMAVEAQEQLRSDEQGEPLGGSSQVETGDGGINLTLEDELLQDPPPPPQLREEAAVGPLRRQLAGVQEELSQQLVKVTVDGLRRDAVERYPLEVGAEEKDSSTQVVRIARAANMLSRLLKSDAADHAGSFEVFKKGVAEIQARAEFIAQKEKLRAEEGEAHARFLTPVVQGTNQPFFMDKEWRARASECRQAAKNLRQARAGLEVARTNGNGNPPAKRFRTQQGADQRRCYGCGEIGHLRRDCGLPRADQQAWVANAGDQQRRARAAVAPGPGNP